jgi:hypothetical protein
MAGMPRVAIVMARLIVDREDRGVRPFVVALGDGKEMCKGVTSKYAVRNTILRSFTEHMSENAQNIASKSRIQAS